MKVKSNELLFGKGATSYDAFNFIQSMINLATRNFPQHYNFYTLDDIDGVEAGFIYKIVISLNTFYSICKCARDYSSATTLCRSIVDKIAILKCVFAKSDQTERSYRYYLYVLDGMRDRLKLLDEELKYDGRISKAEFDNLANQVDAAKENTFETVRYCENTLNSHQYASVAPAFHKKVIKGACWRYKEFGKTQKNGNPDVCSWKELYYDIDNRPAIVSMFSSYLSQFVHSLSISILPVGSTFDDFESLMSIGVCLQGIIIKELKERFNAADEILCIFNQDN